MIWLLASLVLISSVQGHSRLVVLNGDAAEVILVLKAEDKVVGVTDEILRSPELGRGFSGRPSVGRWNSPNLERVVSLKPDLVIAYRRWPDSKLEENLRPFHIEVLRINCYKLDKLADEIRLLGKITGKRERAEELVRFIEDKLALVRERVKGVPAEKRVRVYIESYADYTSVAKGSGGHQMCEMAGGMNIAADQPVPYPRLSPEWVVKSNPQVIVKAVTSSRARCGYGVSDPTPLKRLWMEIVSRPGWDEIGAVKNGRVYLISADIWVGPRGFVGICYMAKWFYPDLFGDLDPEAMHREYLRRFLGVEAKGIFAYEGG